MAEQRILYLPIISPGTYHDVALANKRGLRDAFATVGQVHQFDYVAEPDMFARFRELVEQFQPTLIFTQFQGPDRITPEGLREIRSCGAPIVNWNGDVWEHGLIAPDMLALLREADLQLVINASVLPVYEREGIRAAFWPFGVEMPGRQLPDVPEYDVLFLGNNYSEKRQRLYEILRSLPYRVGIYGSGWQQAEGECNYDFAYGAALYRNAKITISDNQFPEAEGYLSDRPFQAMAAGCLVLQQHVANLEKWTGYRAGEHYGSFTGLAEIPACIDYWLHSTRRHAVAAAGWHFTWAAHSFDRRVRELFEMLEVSRV